MSNTSSELNALVVKLSEIDHQLKLIKAKRQEIRDQIKSLITGLEKPCYVEIYEGALYKLTLRSKVNTRYDTALLKERLGERFIHILNPDPQLIKQNIDYVRPFLEPILPQIGSVSDDRVNTALWKGIIQSEELDNTYEIEEQLTLYAFPPKEFAVVDICSE